VYYVIVGRCILVNTAYVNIATNVGTSLRPIRTTRTYGPYVRAVKTARTYVRVVRIGL